MPQHFDNLFIVTGGPGAGKTTLLDAAAEAGIRVGREAARAIIQSQAVIDGPVHHFGNRVLFAELMLDRDIQTYQALAGGPAGAVRSGYSRTRLLLPGLGRVGECAFRARGEPLPLQSDGVPGAALAGDIRNRQRAGGGLGACATRLFIAA